MKKEEKTEITRNKIIGAAMEEFGTKGYAIGAINNICKSGINKGLVYHNFKDKDALYLECVRKSCERLIQYVETHMETVCFVEYMGSRMHFFTEHPFEASVFLEARTNPPKHLEEQVEEICRGFDGLNRRVMEEELGRFELRDGVSREDALSYFSEIQKVYNLSFAKRLDSQMPLQEQLSLHETSIKKVFDLMLYGIAKGGNE